MAGGGSPRPGPPSRLPPGRRAGSQGRRRSTPRPTTRRSSIRLPDDGLGLRSCLGVPLHARGRTIGTLRLGVGPSGRRFGQRDLRFAEVLADGVALALENAGLSAELEDAERRFRAIVDGMLDGVTVRAADGRLVYANDAALDLLRMDSREELRELPPGATMALFEVYAEDGRPLQLDELPGVRAWNLDADPEPMIVRNVVRATGEQRWLLSKAIAIRDPDGMPMYVVNFTEDITAAKRVELAQRVLAEAGRMLVSSLDYERTLQQVAMLAVPELADWCGVDMPGRGGLIEPVAVGHVDPERVAVARRLRERYPVRIDEADGMAAVVRGDIPHLSSTRRRTRRSSPTPSTTSTSSSCAPSASTRS